MKERIKKIRKELDLTQQKFADKLGVKRNTVGQWECGINAITDQVIISICREFNVNETWLRTGEGEMFNIPLNSALDALAEEYHLTPAAYVMVEKFVNLKPQAQQIIFDYIQEVATSLLNRGIPNNENNSKDLNQSILEAEADYIKSRSNSAKSATSYVSNTTEGNGNSKEKMA